MILKIDATEATFQLEYSGDLELAGVARPPAATAEYWSAGFKRSMCFAWTCDVCGQRHYRFGARRA